MTVNLSVANKSNGNSFSVKVPEGIDIKNYKGSGKPQNAGDVESKAGKKTVTNLFMQNGDKNLSPQRSMNLSSQNYAIFDKLRGLDGDKKNLTEKDLAELRKNPSLWKKLGITDVKYDPNEKVTGVYTSKNSALYFDIK